MRSASTRPKRLRDRPIAPDVRFRRSPHLVGYWTAAGPILENYATRQRAPGTPIVHAVLGAFTQWQPLGGAAKALPDVSPASLARIVDSLVTLTFLDRSHRPAAERSDRWRDWDTWGPAARFFHYATRDVKILD